MKSVLMLLGADEAPDSGLDDAINQIYALEKDLAEVCICNSVLCKCIFVPSRYSCLLPTCAMLRSLTMYGQLRTSTATLLHW